MVKRALLPSSSPAATLTLLGPVIFPSHETVFLRLFPQHETVFSRSSPHMKPPCSHESSSQDYLKLFDRYVDFLNLDVEACMASMTHRSNGGGGGDGDDDDEEGLGVAPVNLAALRAVLTKHQVSYGTKNTEADLGSRGNSRYNFSWDGGLASRYPIVALLDSPRIASPWIAG